MKKLTKFYSVIAGLFLILLPTYCFCSEKTETDALQKRQKLVDYAKQFVGVPYSAGGTTKRGMDCSGLVYTSARESIGLQLPRTVSAIYSYAQTVKDNEKEIGDLLFFQTVGTKISHVAIYMGNDQFIHAASDGPNTGVIVSSLSEKYWKEHYFAVGRILPSSKTKTIVQVEKKDLVTEETPKVAKGSSKAVNNFWNEFSLDASYYFTWNFFNANQILLNPRGLNVGLNLFYTNATVYPGIGVNFRWDSKAKVIQIPVTVTLGFSDYLRVYFGPIITFGDPIIPGTQKAIKASIFPGVIGCSWQSEGIEISGHKLHFTQDIYYSVMDEPDGSSLSLRDSVVSGLVFATGFRVTFPAI